MNSGEMETPQTTKIQKSSVTPSKSPIIQILPPLANGTLIIPKKRSYSIDHDMLEITPSDKIIPVKSRNSTPVSKRRVPSLNDTIIPTLTPDSSYSKTDSPSKSNFSTPSGINSISSPSRILKYLNDSAPESPLENKQAQLQRQLNLEIEIYEKKINILRRAKQILETNEDSRLDELVKKWKVCAQNASTELYVEALEDIKRNGLEQYKKKSSLKTVSKNIFNFDGLSKDEWLLPEENQSPVKLKEKLRELEIESEEYSFKEFLSSINVNYDLLWE